MITRLVLLLLSFLVAVPVVARQIDESRREGPITRFRIDNIQLTRNKDQNGAIREVCIVRTRVDCTVTIVLFEPKSNEEIANIQGPVSKSTDGIEIDADNSSSGMQYFVWRLEAIKKLTPKVVSAYISIDKNREEIKELSYFIAPTDFAKNASMVTFNPSPVSSPGVGILNYSMKNKSDVTIKFEYIYPTNNGGKRFKVFEEKLFKIDKMIPCNYFKWDLKCNKLLVINGKKYYKGVYAPKGGYDCDIEISGNGIMGVFFIIK